MNLQTKQASILDLQDIDSIEKTLDHRILSYDILQSTLNKDSYYYFVVYADNVLVGYLAAELLVDHFDLLAIAVLKEYRNCGMATILLNELFNACKKNNISKVFLEVRCNNIPAITFYEKNKFKNISVRKKYYPDTKEDAYIYLKEVHE